MPTDAGATTRENIEAFLADLADRVAPATTAKHYRSLQQLFKWLEEDGEIPRSPMERMKPPTVPVQPVPIVTDEQLAKSLATCKANTFENRHDSAIIRLLIDTGRSGPNSSTGLRASTPLPFWTINGTPGGMHHLRSGCSPTRDFCLRYFAVDSQSP